MKVIRIDKLTTVSYILIYKAQQDVTIAKEMLKFFDWCYMTGWVFKRAGKHHFPPVEYLPEKKMTRSHKIIEKLRRQLLVLGAEVEERLDLAVKSIDMRDHRLAKYVIENDRAINVVEVELEEECLKVLALHQPVAIDLRVVVAILKINHDLERIGDLAIDIAERSQFLATHKGIACPFDFPLMSEKVRRMLQRSLDALVNLDEKLAHEVCHADDEVDDLHCNMFPKVESALQKYPENIQQLLGFLSVSRYLERIADHATNIAEDVIYLVKGEIVRHSKGIY